jgi:hypothetical protein
MFPLFSIFIKTQTHIQITYSPFCIMYLTTMGYPIYILPGNHYSFLSPINSLSVLNVFKLDYFSLKNQMEFSSVHWSYVYCKGSTTVIINSVVTSHWASSNGTIFPDIQLSTDTASL